MEDTCRWRTHTNGEHIQMEDTYKWRTYTNGYPALLWYQIHVSLLQRQAQLVMSRIRNTAETVVIHVYTGETCAKPYRIKSSVAICYTMPTARPKPTATAAAIATSRACWPQTLRRDQQTTSFAICQNESSMDAPHHKVLSPVRTSQQITSVASDN